MTLRREAVYFQGSEQLCVTTATRTHDRRCSSFTERCMLGKPIVRRVSAERIHFSAEFRSKTL